ncbi:lytic transglycosylase domain-containing protein [Kutzneria sp. NPDC052558]|uniref:lytic transglycosylase domain-containing protein n=1 Tax=Kutzneria sp. NPDC052558 TaxID=3364121 RepID=UPI0037CBFC0E
MAYSTPPRSPAESPFAQSPRPPRRGRGGELFGKIFLVALVLALGAGAIYAVNWLSHPAPPTPPGPTGPPPFEVPPLDVARGSAIPGPATPVPAAQTAAPRENFQGWIKRVAYYTDVPERVLVAYANADLAYQARNPACHLTWATLAGVGRVESKHGRYGGASVLASGEESKPIIGPALDGSPGFLAVPDTDKGALDGDATWDHAVGPMQFAPATWRRWGVRASGDGKAPDPQNIDDAAMTAGRYLCAMGGDLAVPKDWWDGVLAYNNSTAYGQDVFSNADAYGKVSLGRL